MKQYRKIISITINCAVILIIAYPAARLLGREIRNVGTILGIGREARILALFEKAKNTGDPWMKWRYCREILVLDPKDSAALSLKSGIADGYAREARALILEGRTREAIPTLVLAIRVDSQAGYFWVWLEDWINAWSEKHQTTQPKPVSSAPVL